MTAEGWIAIVGIAVVVLVQVGLGIMAFGSLRTKTEANAKSLEWLSANKVSKEEGAGFQAQLTRLEGNDRECDGKIVAMREEFATRSDRLGVKLEAIETKRHAESQGVAAQLAKLEAMMQGMNATLERLAEAEQQRHQNRAQPAPVNTSLDMLDTLRKADEIKRMLKGFVTSG